MSIVALADTNTTVTRDILHEIAAKNNIKLASRDEDAYFLVLQSAEATAATVYELPEYIDPRLAPVPTKSSTRQFRKVEKNSSNAWSHSAKLEAEQPTSELLRGKSIVMKDNMSVGGLPYTCGMFPQFVTGDGDYPIATIDATVTRRILEAGGTIVGTSTCENYSLTPMSYTSANGPVHNPWLPGYNTGGSTSGGACLLALREARAAGIPGLEQAGPDVDIAMGGDQAGSIRMPSSYCGVYGIKPTYGLVPYTGIAGLHPMIDFTGPMGHNIEDLATMLTVLAGYDGLDQRMSPESPLRENVKQYHKELEAFTSSQNKGRGLKIGVISESLTSPGTAADVASVVSNAAKGCFAGAGATVTEVSVPMHLLAPAIWTAATRTNMASLTVAGRTPDMLTHNLPHFKPHWPPNQEMYDILTHHNPAVINVLFGERWLNQRFGTDVQAKAHRHVLQLRAAYDKALEEFDVLVTPTAPTVAPKHPDMRPEAEGGSTLMEKIKLAVGSTNNTCPFNATGHPAMSVPCGWSKSADGQGWFPVGMQIIGRRWDDLGVLKAGKVFEMGGGGLGKWPGLIGLPGLCVALG